METILKLYEKYGNNHYDDIGESVTQTQHMTQAAKFATDAKADSDVVLAALFHDVGHLLGFENPDKFETMKGQDEDKENDEFGTQDHEDVGADFLLKLGFSKKTAEIVRNHVNAKRYLCYSRPYYYEKLSSASKNTLRCQGGPMRKEEAARFEKHPFFKEIILMRTWDEKAKIENPRFEVPGLESYKSMMMASLARRGEAASKTGKILTESQLESWNKNGYLLLQDLLSDDEKMEVISWVDEIQKWEAEPGKQMLYYEMSKGKKMLCRTENFLPFHRQMKEFLTNPKGKVCMAIRDLLGEEPVLFKEKVNYKLPMGGGFPAHQDAPAYTTFKQDNHVTLNVAIDDAFAANGCLEVAPGYHTVGLLPQDELHGGLSKKSEGGIKNWKPVEMKAGDVLLFSSWLPHRSSLNMTEQSRRALYVTYNAASDGDFRDAYYERKRAEYPQECERIKGKDYTEGAKVYNLATPITG